jgi:hypothetical protein
VFFSRGSKSLSRSVSGDWIASLPREKINLFNAVVRRWESTYAMMSIALDEALSLRARGEMVCARQQMEIASELLARLGATLVGACDAMTTSGRHFSHLPPVHPLDSDFFRGGTARGAASWNGLLHTVLFSDRSRFFHKLRILSDTLENLVREFRENCRDIAESTFVEPGTRWQAADFLHYDVSTCLREAEVVLKSFLRDLPSDHLGAFSAQLDVPAPTARFKIRPRLTRVSA